MSSSAGFVNVHPHTAVEDDRPPEDIPSWSTEGLAAPARNHLGLLAGVESLAPVVSKRTFA